MVTLLGHGVLRPPAYGGLFYPADHAFLASGILGALFRSCGSRYHERSAVYAVLKNCVRQDLTQSLTQNEITLEFPGDNLYLSENKEGEIILRGPAECVFKGKMN